MQAASCKLRRERNPSARHVASLSPRKFALCSSQFAVRKLRLRGHSLFRSYSSSWVAACKFLPELRAAKLQLAARSSQLAGSDTELESCRLHVALCTSRFAVLAQGVRPHQIAVHLALRTSQYVAHERASEGLQCAPRTSHVTRLTSESCIVSLAARSLPLAHHSF